MEACLADGFDSMIVFTQFTDTMEYLRDYLADQMSDFRWPATPARAGRGAMQAANDAVFEKEIKRRLRDKQVRPVWLLRMPPPKA